MNLPDGLLADEWTVAAWLLFIPVLLLSLRRAPLRRLRIPPGQRLARPHRHSDAALSVKAACARPFSAPPRCLRVRPRLRSVAGLSRPLRQLPASRSMAIPAGDRLCPNAHADAASVFPWRMPYSVSLNASCRRSSSSISFANGFSVARWRFPSSACCVVPAAAATGVYPLDYVLEEFLPYVLLLGFLRAWLSGMVVTLFVVYRPDGYPRSRMPATCAIEPADAASPLILLPQRSGSCLLPGLLLPRRCSGPAKASRRRYCPAAEMGRRRR